VAIDIKFTADTSKVIRETKDVSKALESVADDLGDLGKDAGSLDDKVSSAFKSMANDAKKAGKDIGDDTTRGFREAGEGAEDFKQEAASTAKESAASFDGSAESIMDSFQEVAANAFAGFGPAGAAAGLAVAVGMGIAISAMQSTAEEANAAKEKSVEMIDSIKEAGGDLAKMDLSEKIIAWGREVMEDNWITLWSNEASTKFQETAKDAKEFGVSSRDAIRAASGSAEDSRKFLDETADDWQNLTREIEKSSSVTEDGAVAFTDAGLAAQKKRDALSDLRGQAEENIKVTNDAVEIYELERDALDHTKEAAEAAADAIKEKADASDKAANAAMDLVTAEHNWITTAEQMNKDIATNGRNIDILTASGRANRDSLVDMAEAANTLRDAQILAGGSVETVTRTVNGSREAFLKAADAAGFDAAQAAALADSYGLIPANVETLVKANGTEEAKAAIDAIPAAKDATVTTTETGSAEAQANIDAIEGKDAPINVNDESTASEVQKRIDGIRGRDLVKIDVDDDYTVSEVQKRIDGIKGRDVFVNLKIGNEFEFAQAISRLTQPVDKTVNLRERGGSSVDQ
jgi:hypothetical protein